MVQAVCKSDHMDEDREYKEAIREFYQAYRPLQKQHNLRMHGYSDRKGDLIEIWENKGSGDVRIVCRVKADNSTDCHRMATESLKSYENTRRAP